MTMNTNQGLIIFSTHRPKSTDIMNEQSHKATLALINESGVEAHEIEISSPTLKKQGIMMRWSRESEQIVRSLTADYKKDNYLVIDSNGSGALYTPAGLHIRELGKLIGVSKETAGNTYIANDGRYYTFRISR